EVLSRARHPQPHVAADALQADGWPRHAQSQLQLWADRHPLDEGTQVVGEKIVPLVAAVVAHFLTQQAGGDADARPGWGRRGLRDVHTLWSVLQTTTGADLAGI